MLLALPAAVLAQDTPIKGIGPTGKIVKLFTRFEFTEGPAADKEATSTSATFRKKDPPWSNAGGAFHLHREFQSCQRPDGERQGRTVCLRNGRSTGGLQHQDQGPPGRRGHYNGKRFNAPNDLVIDKQGGVYFTDPSFRAPKPMPQDKLAVYYVAPRGRSPGSSTICPIPTA